MKQIKQELVDELPICEDGKEKITNLLKGMGYEVEFPGKQAQIGEVWHDSDGDTVLILELDNSTLTACFKMNDNINDDYFVKMDGVQPVKLLAKSLKEYYAKKAKGEL